MENDLPNIFLIVTYSIPNFIETVIGTLILTGILLQTRKYFNQKFGNLKDIYIYVLAVILASIYVISQELKFHNLGGNNFYDPYDLIASIMGLIGIFVIIHNFGFVNKVRKE